MECGSPVNRPEGPESPKPVANLDFVQPALTGGMLLGLLSSLPFISAGNIFCCMWVLAGGGLAAYMLTQQRPGGISYGDGAFVGVLSGLIGAVVATIVSIPLRLLAPGIFESMRAALETALSETPELQGPFRDFMLRVASPEVSALTLGFTFFTNLVQFALFAMIGGILMVALMRRK
jgi:hypothetical protein